MSRSIVVCAICSMLFLKGTGQSTTDYQNDLRFLQETVHKKYANLFYRISAADWDKQVDSLYDRIPKLGKYEVLAGLIRLVALFHVGHTQLSTHELFDSTSGTPLSLFPYRLYAFPDGLYISKTADRYAKALGAKVLRIGNMTSDQALDAIKPLVSFENDEGFLSNGPFYLAIPQLMMAKGIINGDDKVIIRYLKNGKEDTIQYDATHEPRNHEMTGLETSAGWSAARKSDNTPLWQKNPNDYRYMEYLPESKILYVRHSVTLDDGEKTIAGFFQNMEDFIDKHDVDKLVLDIRMNDGGNNYLNKPIITRIIASRKINQKGKFFCIIGRRTFSAAQNLTNELEKYTEVTFVGEPTSENVNFYGDTRTETFPASKLSVRLSWMWWQNMDPRDKRMATNPALAVDMSYNDFFNNIDPAMQVIENAKAEANIDDQLKGFLDNGNYDAAFKTASEYLENPLHKYTRADLERRINTFGYILMGENKMEEANQTFRVNTQLFPNSANAYDSFAECFMRMGKKDEAIKYYQMAIAKDTTGVTAENSKNMIMKIKGDAN
ncbi:MAG TPA: hypothetical protein VKR32_11410 [Puia sp.]|nr:hypothetical protein [Puia sp.]